MGDFFFSSSSVLRGDGSLLIQLLNGRPFHALALYFFLDTGRFTMNIQLMML